MNALQRSCRSPALRRDGPGLTRERGAARRRGRWRRGRGCRARRLADLRNRRLALAAFQSLRSEYSDHDSAGVRSCATRPTAYSPSNDAGAAGPEQRADCIPDPRAQPVERADRMAPEPHRVDLLGHIQRQPGHRMAAAPRPWAAGPSPRTRPTRKPGTAAGPARPPAPVPVASGTNPGCGPGQFSPWPAGHPARKRRPRPEPPQMAQPSMTYRSARPAMASSAAGCSQSNGQLTAAAPPARVRPARPGHCPRPRLPGRLPAGARTAAMGLVPQAGDQPPAQMADHRRADPPRPGAAPIRRGRIAARQCRDASPEDSTRMGTFG